MVLDIIFCFITAFYKEMKPVKNLWEIFKNYATGYMVFDLASTIPGFFTSVYHDFYCFKLLRLMHAKAVYSTVTTTIRAIFVRLGMNKASAEKIGFTIDLLLYLFQSVHLLGCTWIYLGKVIPCSWLN